MPELRKDPVLGRWVIISTERSRRPSGFAPPISKNESGFCPFCYGNEDKTPPEVFAIRPGNMTPNSKNWNLRVVPNKFPALQIEGGTDKMGEGLFDKMNGIGAHEVIIETPEHNTSLEGIPEGALVDIFRAFQERIVDLRNDTRLRYILIFKNHGVEAGASLSHPHSQLIALPIIPNLVREELEGAENHFKLKDRCVYCDIVTQEIKDGIRLVSENQDFVVLSPYAPRFPFETWVIPKRHISSFECTTYTEYASLAATLKDTLLRMNRILNFPPFNLVIHTSPLADQNCDYYHWHIEIMPKLTRVAGFEWGTGFYINPTPPETAAAYLREE
ncbi:MAG: galactose-1-phosphate uridylyltransferase [Nitrospinota bacterium]